MADNGRPVKSLVCFTRADKIEPEPIDWLVEGYLPSDALVGLVGQTGSCKSFAAIDFACRVATGSPWNGSTVKQGQVFYLAGEGRTGLRKRIRAWEIFTGTTIADAPLFLSDSLPFLCDPLNTAGTIDQIQAICDEGFFQTGSDPALIVIDTLARAMCGANENSADDMGRFIAAMDWLRQTWGATVLILHHTGHAESTQERARGSSAFRSALDAEFLIKASGTEITLRSTKAKDWHPPGLLSLRRVEVDVGQGETSLVLSQTGSEGGTERDKRASVFRLHSEGLSIREITAQTGIPSSSVHRWISG